MESSTSREGEPSTKKRKSSESNQNHLIAQNAETQADILKLITDCFEVILDYLDIFDLVSFGQSCKRLQEEAGKWFSKNYSGHNIIAKSNRICILGAENIKINCFSEHISNIIFSDEYYIIEDDHPESEIGYALKHRRMRYKREYNMYHRSKRINDKMLESYIVNSYRYVQSHCSQSLMRNITFEKCKITQDKIELIKNFLHSAECIKITNCSVNGDFHERILQFCGNMKRLHVTGEYMNIASNKSIIGVNNSWLQQKYPNLKQFSLETYGTRVIELCDFFRMNNNHIRKFSTNSDCIFSNAKDFLHSCIFTLLDIFAVNFENKHYELPKSHSFNLRTLRCNLDSFCKILNKLYERGFYGKLYFYFNENSVIHQENIDHLTSLKSLAKIYGKLFKVNLSTLVNLEEIFINSSAEVIDWTELPSKLPNLQQIGLSISSIDHILPFITHATKLRKVLVRSLKNGTYFEDNILDIFALNRQRSMLDGAQKVTIYVNECINLATKTAKKTTERDLIRIKRIDSNDYFHDFIHYL